ncbi:hypothetical protein KCU94_g16298, partial [Aureobasidium melanogenum]
MAVIQHAAAGEKSVCLARAEALFAARRASICSGGGDVDEEAGAGMNPSIGWLGFGKERVVRHAMVGGIFVLGKNQPPTEYGIS